MKKTLTVLLSIFLLINTVNAEELDNNIPTSSNDKSNIINEEVLKNTTSEKQDETSNLTLENKKANQPEEKKTSKKIIEDATVSVEIDWNLGRYVYNVTISFIIPEDYEEDTIVLSPKVYETIKKELDYNGIQPGDDFTVNFKITNKSKYTYTYDEKSFEIFPDDDKDQNKLGEDKKFNGTEVSERNHIQRRFNTALASIINEEQYTKGKINLTDEYLDKVLRENNYNGLSDYTKFLLDFYNKKYSTNHTRLSQFNYGIIKEIFGAFDPLYQDNEAYYEFTHNEKGRQNALGSMMFDYGYTSRAEVKAQIDKLIIQKGFVNSDGSADVIGYLLDFYNKKYNLNLTSLDNLPNNILHKIFAVTDKSYERDNNMESNTEIVALYFDYFYNKGISWTFEDDELTEENTHEFSVGEYMRDESKGDEQLKKSFGRLESNSEKSLNNMKLKFDGKYLTNVSQRTEYDFHIQFSFSILKGNLIVRYIDDEGNELSDPEKYTEIVGTKYKTSEKDFEYYKLIDIKGNEEGEYIDGTTEVTYIYSFVGGIGGDDVDLNFPKTGVEDNNLPEVIFSMSSLLLAGTILLKKKFN